MKLGFRETLHGVLGTGLACLMSVAVASGQAAPQKQLMAEDVYKNIQVLRGIPENQFLATMGFIAGSLAVNCTYCHDESTWDTYAKDNPNKQMARRMILMMSAINQSNFGGKRKVTCWTCHRGGEQPEVTPVLAEVYGAPPPSEPDALLDPADSGPSVDQILNKYVQALGGTQRLDALKSFTAKGTYQGFAELDKVPIEVYAKAPSTRTTVVHRLDGVWTTTTNGATGWVAEPGRPKPLLELTGLFLEGAKLDAELSFPSQIKQDLTELRVGFPSTINDRKVQLIQGLDGGKSVVNLYFDDDSGLLVRSVRFTDSPLGESPTQVDYSDYRTVMGVKLPYRWTTTWLDGRATTELTELEANVTIDASKFAKPAPAVSLAPKQ